MDFDKNQNDFPSELHAYIWNLGIHVLPLDLTLPQEVRNGLPLYLVKSCEQMQKYLLYLLGDIYENLKMYMPLPNQEHDITNKILRPFIDFCLLGVAEEEALIIDRFAFDKLIKKLKNSKAFADDRKYRVSIEQRLKILERTGLKFDYNGNKVILTSAHYPNMFYAMYEMSKVVSDEKAAGDNSFTYCDFRKLCKSYKYDKYENALVFLSDDQVKIAKELDVIANKYKFTRSIKTGHCAGYEIIYKYKKMKIIFLNCLRNKIKLSIQIPYDKNDLSSIESFFESIEKDSIELKKYVKKRIKRCRLCSGNRNCAYTMKIYGNTNKLCFHWASVIRIETEVLLDEIVFIEKILLYIIKDTI